MWNKAETWLWVLIRRFSDKLQTPHVSGWGRKVILLPCMLGVLVWVSGIKQCHQGLVSLLALLTSSFLSSWQEGGTEVVNLVTAQRAPAETPGRAEKHQVLCLRAVLAKLCALVHDSRDPEGHFSSAGRNPRSFTYRRHCTGENGNPGSRGQDPIPTPGRFIPSTHEYLQNRYSRSNAADSLPS